jgi:hypothetical protein
MTASTDMSMVAVPVYVICGGLVPVNVNTDELLILVLASLPMATVYSVPDAANVMAVAPTLG